MMKTCQWDNIPLEINWLRWEQLYANVLSRLRDIGILIRLYQGFNFFSCFIFQKEADMDASYLECICKMLWSFLLSYVNWAWQYFHGSTACHVSFSLHMSFYIWVLCNIHNVNQTGLKWLRPDFIVQLRLRCCVRISDTISNGATICGVIVTCTNQTGKYVLTYTSFSLLSSQDRDL